MVHILEHTTAAQHAHGHAMQAFSRPTSHAAWPAASQEPDQRTTIGCREGGKKTRRKGARKAQQAGDATIREAKEKKKGEFRLNAKNLFLTYPRCFATHIQLADQLKKKFNKRNRID